LYAFRGDSPPGGNPVVRQKREEEEKADEALFCKSCGGHVTRKEQAIGVNGSHTHTFFNPDGIVFELGCFRDAPGALPVGDVTPEFTWFAGYVWCFTLCRRCGIHLGWHYESRESGFFGLILARLTV